VVVYLLRAGVAAVCCLHCSHRRCNNVALDLPRLLLTTMLWSIYFSKYLVRVRANVIVLGCGVVLPRLEVDVVTLIVVEYDEPLIGVVYLVSLQPDPRDGLIDCALSACRGSVSVQGQCLNEHVPGADELAAETLCRGVEPHQLLGPCGLLLCSVHCVGWGVLSFGGG
jgi:hypothetical protein